MFRFGLFIAFVFSLLTSSLQAQVLETSLSKDTLLYFSVPTGKEFQQQVRNSSLGKLFQEPEVQHLLQKISRLVSPYFQRMDENTAQITGKTLWDWLNSFEGEISFAIQKMEQIPEAAFALGFSDAKLGQATLQNMYERFQMTPEKNEQDGQIFETLRLPGGPPIFLGWKQNTLVFSFHPEMLLRILNGKASEEPLAQDSLYQQVSQVVGENKSFRFWLNLRKIMEHPLFQQDLSPLAQAILNKLGIDQWTTLNMACWFDQLDLKFAFQLGSDTNEVPRGLNVLFPNQALAPHIFSRIPKSVTHISALQFDIVAFYQQLQQILEEFAPEVLGFVQPYLTILEQDMGISFQEIYPLSVTTYSFISFEDNIGEQSIWCLHPQNAQEWSQKIVQLFQKRFDIAKKTYRGKDIYQIRIDLGRFENGLANITPAAIVTAIKEIFALPSSFYVDENRVVMAHLPQTLMDFIDELETPGTLPPQVSAIINEGVAHLSWSPVGNNGEAAYHTICELSSMFFPLLAAFTPSDITSFDLPRAESVLKHARPSFSYTKAGNGLSVSQVNLIPTSMPQVGLLGATAVGGIVAAVAIPGLLRARISSNETSAIGTLRTIATAQNQFQYSTLVDQDQDGIGEFGWLQELSGIAICRAYGKQLRPPFMTSVLGETAQTNGGIATKNGYHFLMYLPSESGRAMAEPGYFDGSTTEPLGQDGIDEQEMRFICYAWPIDNGSSGYRCFVINQSGEVFMSYANYSGLDSIPQPDAALSFGEGSANLQTEIVEGSGNDGNNWTPAY